MTPCRRLLGIIDTGHCAKDQSMPINIPVPQHTIDSEHDALIEQNSILRGANQNLMLATFGAEDLRDQAEAAHRHQNEFLAMLAHELRNPLAPIGLASAMLGKLPAPSIQLLHIKSIIDRQVGQLSRLLDDLLDAARISSGKIELHRKALLVADQLANALETVQSRLLERKQQLILELPDQAIWISGDAVRLAQVFSNLLVNASKFTQDGGRIVLRACVDGDDVSITIEDNGVGISADVIPTIFTLFSQGPRTLARSEGGLGVGLNIVRNVIEMHGGSVNVASPGLGHGTIFTLRLPLLEIVDHQADALLPDTEPTSSHHILLVEDNVDASEMLKMVLCSENHTIVAAFDGIAGLALACAGGFDVVVCDIGLPGISGYDLVRTLRATTGASAPFCVAVSGYGQLEDRTRALAAGFDHHLVKPIDVDNLLQLIASVPHKNPHDR
jgi:signal transduction histidine kinase/ActR/RegA family two-component response regulator